MIELICTVPLNNPLVFGENFGRSESASVVVEQGAELMEDFARTITFGQQLSKMIESIIRAKDESSVENWDGYNAKAISGDSFQSAIRFALSFPLRLPTPQVYVDPDGEVTFEWYEDKRKVFSVSIGSRNRLSYAGLYGQNEVFGVEHFYDDIPESILGNINRLYSE